MATATARRRRMAFGLRPGDPALGWRPSWPFAALWLLGGEVAAAWAFEVPRRAGVPPLRPGSAGLSWLVDDGELRPRSPSRDLTRAIAAVIEVPYQIALGLLSTADRARVGRRHLVPPLSLGRVSRFSSALARAARLAACRLAAARGRRCFLYLAVFGQWKSAMVTLASILVAVPLGVAGGLLLGIARLPLAALRAGDACRCST